MLCVLSPAKSMDLSGGPNCGVMSQPGMKDTKDLLAVCKRLTASDMKKLMGVSDAIASKDVERYQKWEKNQCKAACLAMDGPAYRGFDGSSLSPTERKVAQGTVRILSGLYGVLKPFDAIRPYRLEMGSKLKTSRGNNLYDFWGEGIAKELRGGAKLIVNAASQEYWKAVNLKALGVPVVTVDFPGPSVYAKKARGLICRFVVQNNCKRAEDLKAFKGAPGDSYAFDAKSSTSTKFVFRRVADSAAGMTSKTEAALKRPAAASSPAPAKRSRRT
eukprot:TRINITY_DN47625_c0_g1_i1.p1 TRINITY_DN47625_c0_g1~~TRINITY_DN47625_c0_g1_i1.p1  ORF type:complete len:274 (-),score=41.70 TRINITY_DN47625_c0_g1_i1:115-936(-)